MDKIPILYIDDEVHNLNAFRASFRRDYAVYTATEIHEAHMVLDKYTIPIIIADQRMPGTTGIEFFHSIKDRYSDSIRILITAYTEAEDLVDAINKGQIYRFIKKPWEYYDLQATIFNAYEIYKTKKALKDKLKDLGKNREERSQFIKCVSGDIQGLILSSIGVINLMKTDPKYDGNEYVDVLENNITKIKDFAGKMLGYYKNTDFFLNNEEIDFESLIENAIKKHQSPVVDIDFDTKIEQKHSFFGDFFRINMVLDYLIDNGVKYRSSEVSKSMVCISVRTERKGVNIGIKDNGIGIKKEFLKHLFNLFYSPQNVENSGFGVGLYIVKEAIARMNGEIFIDSVFGEGTEIKIYLPSHEPLDD